MPCIPVETATSNFSHLPPCVLDNDSFRLSGRIAPVTRSTPITGRQTCLPPLSFGWEQILRLTTDTRPKSYLRVLHTDV